MDVLQSRNKVHCKNNKILQKKKKKQQQKQEIEMIQESFDLIIVYREIYLNDVIAYFSFVEQHFH